MEHRRFTALLTLLVAMMAIQKEAEAQQLPRLVVCITVNELRGDYLDELSPLMGNDGLKRILNTASLKSNVSFPLYQPNEGSATATIFTGAYPAQSGWGDIVAYDRNARRYLNIMTDDACQGIYTRDNYSPKNLFVETLGDRLKQASGGSSLVYSVAPSAQAAIASSGLSADGAYWLDDAISSWATSNYYGSMLPQLEQYNRSSDGPNKRIVAGITHRPLRSLKKQDIAYNDYSRAFVHRYNQTSVQAYKSSGLINEEITSFAVRLLEQAGYAERRTPGLLALSYTAKTSGLRELEAEDVDTYLRLDESIARLLKALEDRIGLKNCLITLSGTGYTSYLATDDKNRTSRLKRELSETRITALINMYLTALYGSGEWIAENSNGRIYLQKKTIEERKLSLDKVQREVANFLKGASGISYAIAASDIPQSTDLLAKSIERSVHPKYAADVYWSVLPSWTLTDVKAGSHLQYHTALCPSPFAILGADEDIKRNHYEVRDVRDIVRVICSILRIRPPTA